MKKLRVYRVDSPDGEIHLVIEENHVSENSECFTEVAEKDGFEKRSSQAACSVS